MTRCQWKIENRYCSKPDVLIAQGSEERFPACSIYEGSEYCYSKEPEDFETVYAKELAEERARQEEQVEQEEDENVKYSIMRTKKNIKDIFEVLSFTNIKIEDSVPKRTVTITVKSFRKLNQNQIEFLGEREMVNALYTIKVVHPIFGYVRQQIGGK